MHVIVIAGLSKTKGDQFSLKHEYVLAKNGVVMTYSNLRSHFGCPPADVSLSDYSTPYRAGIHLYNYLQKQGTECTLINFLDLELAQFEEAARSHPDVVAISTSFLISIRAVKRVTEMVRRYAPRTKIVVGGPLVYNSYLLYQMKGMDYYLEPCRKDYFFLGEEPSYKDDIDFFVVEEQGEYSLARLVAALDVGEDPSDVPNIAFYKSEELIFTVREAEHNDFSDDLVDWKQVPPHYLHPIFPVRGSRGCPYRCKYCNFVAHRDFLIKHHDVLATELASLSATGQVQIVRFTDDNLFLNRKNLELFCETIIKSGGGMKWTSFIRANSITRENVTLLKESGCMLAQIGMESGDATMLARMNKKDTPDSYLEAVELLNTHGIFTQMYFIVGFPGETTETLNNTVRLINQFKHDGPAANFIMMFPFVLAPLSPVYAPESRAEFELTGYMSEWRHSTMDSKQAAMHARDLLLRIKNVYPFYGIGELAALDAETMKQLSHLRLELRKAEMSAAPSVETDRLWNELRILVTRLSSVC
jgi:radical SAM superfamily enzyme YgiQ (UPF0313 family)